MTACRQRVCHVCRWRCRQRCFATHCNASWNACFESDIHTQRRSALAAVGKACAQAAGVFKILALAASSCVKSCGIFVHVPPPARDTDTSRFGMRQARQRLTCTRPATQQCG